MTATWGEITADEILLPVRGRLISGKGGTCFTGLSTDSRQIIRGQLFWAIKGERYDGHDFLLQAAEKGAAGIVLKKDRVSEMPPGRELALIAVDDTLKALGDLAAWWRRRHAVQVAAITGSVGKSTTKEMTASILRIGEKTLKTEGNYNNLVGLPLTIFSLREEHRRAVLEMGMNVPGEIARLTEIADPDIGVITNVARAHLEGLGDIRGVARAKTELIEKISSKGRVLLNGDDETLMQAAARFQKKMATFGLGAGNEFRAEDIRDLGRDGVAFLLKYSGNTLAIRLRVPGLHNVSNALAASAAALCLQTNSEHIAAGLRSFEGMKGRFMPVALPGGAILLDDTYNSNPASLGAALHSIRSLTAGRGGVILGLGEMMELGDETVSAHLEAGEMAAAAGARYLLAMGEHGGEIIKGAVARGFPPERTFLVENHREMAHRIKEIMREGDLILLKGSRKVALEEVSRLLVGGA